MTARLHRLTNGVRVVVDPMPGLESAALCVVTGAGARCEPAEQNGWSHLLEHMVFKGAGERSARDIVEAVEGEGGWINAATGYERTSFQVRHLAGGLPLAMSVLADLLRRPHLDPAELEREKGVIAQEIAEAADTPDDQVFELAQAARLRRPAARPADPRRRGDASPPPRAEALHAWRRGALRRSVAAWWSPPRGRWTRTPCCAPPRPPSAISPRRPSRSPPVDPIRFAGGARPRRAGWSRRTSCSCCPASASAIPPGRPQRLFAEILGGGMASRLFQEAREKRGLAYAVDAYAEAYADGGLLGVYAGASRQGRRAPGRTRRRRD